jgi:NADH-quinone oxidoreductase subunit C
MFEELADAPPLRLVAEALRERIGEALLETTYEKRELAFRIKPDDLLAVLEFLKVGQGFGVLDDIIGLDRSPAPGEGRKRFSVLYQLYRFADHIRVRIAIDVDESEQVPSIITLYPSADWAEREVFDMFGLRFRGRSELRRIYLDDEFAGHPLRKDFPLQGQG